MSADQPYSDAVDRYLAERPARFHVPGHGGGVGAGAAAQKLGATVFARDLTEVLDFDDIHHPFAAVAEAQRRAARLFGSQHSYFLVNGSSCGNQAMLLAAARENETVVVPRSGHRSLFAGLQMSGARPIYYSQPWDADWGIFRAPTLDTLTPLGEHPLVLTRPTYYGDCLDLAALRQALPDTLLLVDEAWGAHYGFHPQLPQRALSLGADAAVQSTHKRLGALTQAAMLHVQGQRLDRQRLEMALRNLQSSSPSTLLLASLDGARHDMEARGEALWQRSIELALELRSDIDVLPGLRCLPNADPTHILIHLAEGGWTGQAAERFLRERHAVQVEMSDAYNVLVLVGLGQIRQHTQRLLQGLKELCTHPAPERPPGLVPLPPPAQLACTPRQASQLETRVVSLEGSLGHIAAEMICPYPPGIPVLCPGEVIDGDQIEYLKQARALGTRLQGAADPELATLRVLRT